MIVFVKSERDAFVLRELTRSYALVFFYNFFKQLCCLGFGHVA